jgi:hypothetical protein
MASITIAVTLLVVGAEASAAVPLFSGSSMALTGLPPKSWSPGFAACLVSPVVDDRWFGHAGCRDRMTLRAHHEKEAADDHD